jgi:flagellar biosynthesis protein FlhB
MSASDEDKTEEPTSHKLEQAREKGDVARSTDLTGLMVMIAFALTLIGTASWVGPEFLRAFQRLLGLVTANVVLNQSSADSVLGVVTDLMRTLIPAFLAMVIVAVAANVWQVGFQVSTEPLRIDFSRLNPVPTIKKMFAKRTLWEVGKALLKLFFLSLVLIYFVKKHLTQPMTTSLGANDLPKAWLASFSRATLITLGILFIFAVLDYLFTQFDFHKKMRMSRKELKDDVKKQEGDPEIRSKRKQIVQELLKKAKALGQVKNADIVITNPTHIAVALQFCPKTMRAPIVVAKGKGFMAALIRQQASIHHIPMTPNPALARALFKACDIRHPVPENHFIAIAKIYREKKLLSTPD